MDPTRMGHAIPPGSETFEQKLEVRNAIEAAGIPHTYLVGACFAAYFVGNLSQMGTLIPPKKNVDIYGDGNVKGIITLMRDSFHISFYNYEYTFNQFLFPFILLVVFIDEDDMAKYTAKTLNDPRTMNKTVFVRPTDNILTQMEIVQIWEKLTGKELDKTYVSANDFLADIEGIKSDHCNQTYLLDYIKI